MNFVFLQLQGGAQQLVEGAEIAFSKPLTFFFRLPGRSCPMGLKFLQPVDEVFGQLHAKFHRRGLRGSEVIRV